MNEKLNEVLSRVAEEVFESLAFVLPAFGEETPTAPDSTSCTAAAISFDGPFQGTLTAKVADELLPEIAANMLGMDFGEVPAPEVQRDAFKELLNVICGNLLPVLAGEEAVFGVAAAKLLAEGVEPGSETALSPVASARLQLESGWAEFSLCAPESALRGTEAVA